jgi:Ca-activated chloride channel family protein
MGFGPDYQEDLMASIARTGGGNYTYIAHAGQVAAAFARELTGAMAVVATKASLRFELPDNNQLAGDIDTMLPDIEAGTTIERLVTIKSGPRGTGQYRILKASVDATSPSTRQAIRASADAIVTFADAPNAASAPRHPAVNGALGLHSAALDLEKTLNGMRTMNFSAVDVTQMLNRTQAMLAQTGRVQEAAQVADATRAFQTGNQDHLEKTLVGTLYALDLGKTGGPA